MCEKHELDKNFGMEDHAKCCYNCKWNSRDGKCLKNEQPDESLNDIPLIIDGNASANQEIAYWLKVIVVAMIVYLLSTKIVTTICDWSVMASN